MNVDQNSSDFTLDTPCVVVDTSNAQIEAASTWDASPETLHFREVLQRAVVENREKKALLTALASVVSKYASPKVMLYFERDQSDALGPGLLLAGNAAAISDEFQKAIHDWSENACTRGQLAINRPKGSNDCVLSALIYVRHGEPEVLTAVFSTTSGSLDRFVGVLELVAAQITLWYVQRDAQDAEFEAQSTAALQELLTRLEESRNLQHAHGTLVNELGAYLGCDRVALALCSGRQTRCRLQAISGVKKFDKHAPFAATIESALDESILRESLTVWPPLSPSDRHAALAHHKLCGVANVQCVVSSPLRDEQGEVIGAWLFLGSRECFQRPAILSFIRASEARVASCLSLLRRAEGGPVAKLRRSLFGKRHPWKLKLTLLGLCALLAVLALPMPYKIGCDCRLEPVSRRFVAAPHDGILEKVLVGSGATVAQGDVLARMDGRELRWELAGIGAERDRAVKQRDAAFATHEFAAVELGKLDVDRLELKMQLLEHRQENLELRSPIDGIVTIGDLEKAQGAPVACGQTLFEVAPLTEMIVEVAIPESEIPYVQVGHRVAIHLDAYSSKPCQGTIERIRPRTEIREHQNVFLAEVILENSDGTLRPGMQGRAKIVGPSRALAWNLFHKPWEALNRTLRW